MRHIKYFKNVAFAAATTIIAATPILITSCTKTTIKKQELDSIKIDLPDEDFSLAVGERFVSQTPIDVVCLDKEGQTIDTDTSFVLTVDEQCNDMGWIWIDQSNRINIIANIIPGTYHFHIFAQSKDKKIKSKIKNFIVNVYLEKQIPDEISIILPQDEQVIFVTQAGNVPINLFASKPGFEEFELDKTCNWEITNLEDLPLDLEKKALFSLRNDLDSARLVLSTHIDNSYEGTYSISIKATCKQNPDVYDEKIINIQVANGLYFKEDDEVYTRQSLDDDWELTRVGDDTTILEHIRDNVYGQPVTKISDYFSTNSKSDKISIAIIPPFIKTIGSYAFYNQTLLSELSMPGVTRVEKFAFYFCINIASMDEVDQPDLTYIGDHAFFHCYNLKLNKLMHLEFLGDDGISYVYMDQIHIGPSIKFMGYNCITQNTRLTDIYIDATTPPELAGALWSGTVPSNPHIHVPTNSLWSYRTSLCWEKYSQNFVGN